MQEFRVENLNIRPGFDPRVQEVKEVEAEESKEEREESTNASDTENDDMGNESSNWSSYFTDNSKSSFKLQWSVPIEDRL